MFESNKVYKNRYGDEYHWEAGAEIDTYIFHMKGNSLEYARMGGHERQVGIDPNDLGMFDPSGGPYVAIGTGIDGKKIVNISQFEKTFKVVVVA